MTTQSKSNSNTKNSKEKWLYLYISVITAVVVSLIYTILTQLNIVQAIIMIITTVFIIGLICFFGYHISKSNLKSVETSLNNYIKQNIETPLNSHIKQLEESCERIELYSKQNKVATIDYSQISNFIRDAKTIWVMNPLRDLSFVKNDIEDSIEKGCARIYIIPDNEHVWYKNRVREIRDEMYEKSQKYLQVDFDLLPINPKYLFPLSFVICDPDKPSKTRVWVQPTRDMTKDNCYGLYMEDNTVVSQFVGTFSAISERLSKGGS